MFVYSIYFSPTGGTKKVAAQLLSAWPETTEVDLSLSGQDYSSYCFGKDDLCMIAVPAFEGRVPPPALERLQQMTVHGSRAILVGVYGNRAIDDTLLELKDHAEQVGFSVIAAISAVAQHSVLPMYGTGRPDDIDCLELQEFSVKLKALAEQEVCPPVTVPGNRPYIVIKGPEAHPQLDTSLCNKCGVCAELCPVSAIPPDVPEQIDRTKCIRCLRCVTVCPTNARTIPQDAVQMASQRLAKLFAGRKPNTLYL